MFKHFPGRLPLATLLVSSMVALTGCGGGATGGDPSGTNSGSGTTATAPATNSGESSNAPAQDAPAQSSQPSTGTTADSSPAPDASIADAFPPKANAAWVYDPKDASHKFITGSFVDAIKNYNLLANTGHRVKELYTYGGDLEMFCSGGDPTKCTADDLHVYYSKDATDSAGTATNASALAYADGVKSELIGGAPIITPILDGMVQGSGPLGGFNDLSPAMAQAFADKVAETVCSDPAVNGIEFDLEPFNVSQDNGQYRFYLRIAEDFASSAQGCVDAAHPKGRFFGIFGSANALRPGTDSSTRVAEILTAHANGYWIDPLYDLSSDPSGQRTSVDDYLRIATAHAGNMAQWAKALGVKYQFGIPAAASYHEFQDCSGSACAGAAAPTNGQVDYATAALQAIEASGARSDDNYLGTVLWAWSPRTGFGDTEFGPTDITNAVAQYLSGML